MYRFNDGRADHAEDPKAHGYRPETHTANGPYRGTKADIFESGHRVYFAARWPGVIQPGSVSAQTVSLVDLFATIAALTNATVEEGAGEDSTSMLATLRNANTASTREPIIMHSVSGMFAIRRGDWKLILGNGSGGRAQPKGKPFEKPYQLFNLKDDPAEANDCIESHPEIARELEEAFHAIHKRNND